MGKALNELLAGISDGRLGREIMRRVTARGLLKIEKGEPSFVWSPDGAALIGRDVKRFLGGTRR